MEDIKEILLNICELVKEFLILLSTYLTLRLTIKKIHHELQKRKQRS